MDLENHRHYVGFENHEILMGYTKRTGGRSNYPADSFNMALYIGDDDSNVHAHQDTLGREIGFLPENWVLPIQKHGRNIREVEKRCAGMNVRRLTGDLHDVDGIYTYDSGLLLTMNYADCIPVYMWSRKNSFTALAHAGWRGTSHNITGRMAESYDGDPADLEVVIGVGINGHCYTVGGAVINALEAAGLPKEAVESHQDGFDLDLKAVNRHQAIMAGVGADSVHVTEIGTEDTERFFSYRLESGVTGRALAFIGRK
ncbi:MAG TPA: polyphenol oxidase family protein [Candidatus Salinicoccus stercoripullorum]|uniref:Polyphenol oxidase family protein n=1 Tax=Candidatus Salinicoccus stercoripullorum TaxID=2838756 RepID=A0A9D1QED6_9STAP|nr:polyphenol oxidase family protein [Candidatus Salinicoccus stercoripullorum]